MKHLNDNYLDDSYISLLKNNLNQNIEKLELAKKRSKYLNGRTKDINIQDIHQTRNLISILEKIIQTIQ